MAEWHLEILSLHLPHNNLLRCSRTCSNIAASHLSVLNIAVNRIKTDQPELSGHAMEKHLIEYLIVSVLSLRKYSILIRTKCCQSQTKISPRK